MPFSMLRLTSCCLFAAVSLLGESGTIGARPFDQGTRLQFDIPSQSLAAALKTYGMLAGLQLFYESGLIDGRHSPPVHGVMSAAEALRLLLDGTGLSATSLSPGTLTIVLSTPAQTDVRSRLAAIKLRTAEFRPYLAVVQADVRSALCRSQSTQIDASAHVLRLWIAPSGAVERAQFLSPGGSEERNRTYAAAISALVLSEAPPARMPQPITMMILPRDSRTAAECANGSTP